MFDPRLGADTGVTAIATWRLLLWHQGYPDQARKMVDEAPGQFGRLEHARFCRKTVKSLAALGGQSVNDAIAGDPAERLRVTT